MRLVSVIVAAIGFGLPASADAEPVCMQSYELSAALKDWYGEVSVGHNVATGQQLWASKRTGTWSLVEQRRDGTACVIETGVDYASFEGDQNLMKSLNDLGATVVADAR